MIIDCTDANITNVVQKLQEMGYIYKSIENTMSCKDYIQLNERNNTFRWFSQSCSKGQTNINWKEFIKK